MAKRQFWLRKWVVIGMVALSGCAYMTATAGYNSLPPGERVQYLKLADRMSVDQRVEYLSLHEPEEREAYLRENGFIAEEESYGQMQVAAKSTPHGSPASVTAKEESTALFTFHRKAAVKEKPMIQESVRQETPVVKEETALLEHEKRVQEKEHPEDYNQAREAMLEKEAIPPSVTEVPADETEIIEEQVETQPVPVVKVPAAPTTTVQPVPYQKTGDPVKDVLALLDLYEAGKITKEQFDREKEIALGGIPK